MSRPSLPWVAALVAILLTPADGSGQQVLEVDYEAGRIIIDDEWRGLFSHFVAVDWDYATPVRRGFRKAGRHHGLLSQDWRVASHYRHSAR